jgi:hypothetical protein
VTNRYLTSKLLDSLASILTPAGFKRKGRKFRRSIGQTVQIIELQKSTSSTSSTAKVRLNLGSFLVALGPSEALEGSGPHYSECHWRKYLDPQPDADWWVLSNDDDLDPVFRQLEAGIRERVLPEMDQLSSIEGFVNRWRSGRGTGITKKQQAAYLSGLTKSGSA